METEIYQRIVIMRKQLRITQEDLAEKLHMSRSNIANIELGRTRVTERLIADICDRCAVNETWLRTGQGEMFKSRQTEDKIIEAFGRVVKMPDDAFVKQFVAALAELSPDDWKRVEEFARRVVEGGLKNEKDD